MSKLPEYMANDTAEIRAVAAAATDPDRGGCDWWRAMAKRSKVRCRHCGTVCLTVRKHKSSCPALIRHKQRQSGRLF